MYKLNFISKITKISVEVLFFIGIAAIISVPFVTPYLFTVYNLNFDIILPLEITIIVAGICAEYVLFMLIKIFNTMKKGNPFVNENAVHLKKIAITCFVLALIFILKFTYWFTLATALLVPIFILAGMFCLTLKSLFTQAVQFKQDNDLTI